MQATLYLGINALFDEMLMDWQFQQEESVVKGIFFENGKPIKTDLIWPLKDVNQTANCNCADYNQDAACKHVAALAIETKVRLERLPPPVKSVETFATEHAYFQSWLKRQTYNPFPNMARHRVIYLLDNEDNQFSITVHKAYLTQQNNYQRKAELEWSSMNKGKLPKFVSLTDQEIFEQMRVLVSECPESKMHSYGVKLVFPQCFSLLKNIVVSGRCFWRSCHRLPLVWQRSIQSEDSDLLISENLSLNRTKSQILHQENTVAVDVNLDELGDVMGIIPRLVISSDQVHLPWSYALASAKHSVQINFAKISFQVGESVISLQSLMDSSIFKEPEKNHQVLEKICSLLHLLDGFPGVGSFFEPPISQKFDISDRYLEGDFSHWIILFRGLHCEGWKVVFDDNFLLNQKKVDDWYSLVTASDENVQQNWFDLEVGVKVDGKAINILPYIVHLLEKEQWNVNELEQEYIITLDNGSRIRVAAERLKNIVNNLIELSENKSLSANYHLRMPTYQYSQILVLEKALGQVTEWKNAEWLEKKVKRLEQLTQPELIAVPQNINAILRDYQKEGVSWLQLLRRENFSGILADDMGLGKTLQTLTHIQVEKNENRLDSPILIVAPTSLLGNWAAESKRFTPELNVLEWAGGQRKSKVEQLSDADIIITSYGVLLRDFEKLNQLDLYYLILDEAQTIKNARSKISKVAYAMKAQYRLCLTGTPLENHLGELWSLFHFLMPDFLGNENQFKRLFRWPIEKENDLSRQKVLAERIAPFMLRRTKSKVASDLPEKTMINEYVELSETQTDLYEAVRISLLEEVQTALASSGLGRNKILISQALLRLRQICCHPALAKIGKENKHWEKSAKLKWLSIKVPEMVENQQKILIFSSFTSMLDKVSELLDFLGIPFITLTGKTQNRDELVKKFQAGKVPIFLISLKAGGAGLNLTQADTVIHVDPWWNPAAENQASDRAHRIGQNKPVFVYKLISRGTVEERIHLMQQKKSELAEDLYRQQASSHLFNETNWQALLAPLED